jgi:hypothetical protein
LLIDYISPIFLFPFRIVGLISFFRPTWQTSWRVTLALLFGVLFGFGLTAYVFFEIIGQAGMVLAGAGEAFILGETTIIEEMESNPPPDYTPLVYQMLWASVLLALVFLGQFITNIVVRRRRHKAKRKPKAVEGTA